MDKLLETIKNNRSVRDTTLKLYKTNLNKLSNEITDEDFKNTDFLVKKSDKVLEFLESKSNSVKKKFLASIMIALSPKMKNEPEDKDKDAYLKYKNLLNKENGIYLDSVRDNNKSERDKKNWSSMEDIIKVRESILKQIKAKGYNFSKSTGVKSKKDFFQIQDYIISSLYTYLPPRRLDYAGMKKINKSDYDKLSENDLDNNNYLVSINKSNKFLHFGKNSVKSETENNVTIQIPKKLNPVLNFWFKVNKTPYLLVSRTGDKLTKNALSKILVEIFKPTGKNISVVMLRKIYLSEKYAELNKEKEKDAEMMNHSVGVANNFYVKED